MTDPEWIGHIEGKVEEGKYTRQQADSLLNATTSLSPGCPLLVSPVPQFQSYLKVLQKIFNEPLPPVVRVRSAGCMVIVYGFVDASGSGFGSTMCIKGKIKYRIGTWSSNEDKNSSNWREFENLVCEVKQAGERGWLEATTVVLATDNQVVEACLHKGNSSSQKLFNLVVRLKLAEMKYGMKILVTHVSGNRMKAQGTDGVSRGSLRSGVTVGEEMIEYCPWGKDPLHVSPLLKTWLESWLGKNTIFLTPKDWYTRGHDIDGGSYNEKRFWYPKYRKGIYVWSPPPAAADACLEELRKARMKRKASMHIVIIQNLMTPTWLKQLYKAADCIFTIPACHDFWPAKNFESLSVAILFPYLPYRPFQLKSTPKMLDMGRRLCKVFKEDKVDGRDILLKLLLEVGSYKSLPQRMVWKMLYFARSPPFPLWLQCDGENKREQSSGWKRQNHQVQQMARKRTKPTGFSRS